MKSRITKSKIAVIAVAYLATSYANTFAQETVSNLTIDSTLTVGDSALFNSNLEVAGRTTMNGEILMREDATAKRDFTVEENTLLKGNLTTLGTISYPNAPLFGSNALQEIITRDPVTGALEVYPFAEMVQATFAIDCNLFGNNNANPTWHNAPGKLFPSCPETFVGIGNMDPQKGLHVTSEALFESFAEFTYTASVENGLSVGTEPSEFSKFKVRNTARPCAIEINQVGNNLMHNKLLFMEYDNPATEVFKIVNTAFSTQPLFFLEGNGRLTIHNGTQKIFQLNPDGVLRTRTVKVDTDNWPDYVFKRDYELLALSQVKAYIDANGHLPEVPSAEQTESEGIDVGEMNKILLKKVEELTLYLLQQEERIKGLEAANAGK